MYGSWQAAYALYAYSKTQRTSASLQRVRRDITESVQVCRAICAVQRTRLVAVFRLRLDGFLYSYQDEYLIRNDDGKESNAHRSNGEQGCVELERGPSASRLYEYT